MVNQLEVPNYINYDFVNARRSLAEYPPGEWGPKSTACDSIMLISYTMQHQK